MNRKLLKLLTGVLLTAFLFTCSNAAVEAARLTKTLAENTKITPPGVIVVRWDDIPRFKKGTVVTLNEYGEVMEGTLAENVSLPYESGTSQDSIKAAAYTPVPFYVFTTTNIEPTNRVLPFKGGTAVTFNDKGEVIKGTISSSNESITLNPANRIQVANGEVSFHKNGMLATCTLARDSYLRPVGWPQVLTDNFTDNMACSGFVEFKAGQPIVLNEKGEVVKGTLNKDTKLLSTLAILSSSDGVKVYEAGTAIEFNEKGIVVKAAKATSAVN